MSTQAKTPTAADGDPVSTTLPALRHDGWTPSRQAAFLRALASSHNVSAAARLVGMTRQSAYKLRARLRGEPFDYAWDAAFQSSFDALAEAAMDRALNGIEVPHYHQGEVVGSSRRYDERLTIALLAMRGRLRPSPPDWHAAASYSPERFNELVARVERGPEDWDTGEFENRVAGSEPGEGAPRRAAE